MALGGKLWQIILCETYPDLFYARLLLTTSEEFGLNFSTFKRSTFLCTFENLFCESNDECAPVLRFAAVVCFTRRGIRLLAFLGDGFLLRSRNKTVAGLKSLSCGDATASSEESLSCF